MTPLQQWLRMVVVCVVFLSIMSQCWTLKNNHDQIQVETIHSTYNSWNIGHHRKQLLQLQAPKSSKIHKPNKSNNNNNKIKETTSPSPSYFPSSSLSPNPESFSPSETPSNSPSSPLPLSPEASHSPSPSPSKSNTFIRNPSPLPSPLPASPPSVVSNWISAPSPAPLAAKKGESKSYSRQHFVIVWSTVGGFSFLVLVTAIVFACFRSNKVVTVKPWATGLSGQLQKAFVTGVPSLKRSELEVACEYFSNIIGSIPDGTVYKGTLSSGVEIAVAYSSVTSSKNWLKSMEAQYRKKIETLSRVNHKNFLNLIGYCEERKPFTRVMVFEYAPNGTLFEHLHVLEAEQLDWGMRVRIAMGIAYCLEHLHQLTPAVAHGDLISSSIYLTEDYAAKLSDLSFWNNTKGSEAIQLSETTWTHIKDNVYSFGMILFELITGRIPYAVENGFRVDWTAEYIRRQPLKDMVDTRLNNLKESEVEKWSQVIKSCVHPNAEKRPNMREVVAKLKEITAMEPDGATPKSSPLWWAELEIMDANSDINP
ncbi:inactive receptor-like serine/threonine-protein kinase At2g40270 [Arachis stenosperma]|uniref:inactive receptor-like serine/threonine-protein kinase At2g40270 n=1 Tax=Arachis stenosperma TaxID=217475 RepID=UPI0025AB87AB|nr:inactive receptor-like serine/threonine-protein kinase At2g40270 [Arachis stenosperma]